MPYCDARRRLQRCHPARTALADRARRRPNALATNGAPRHDGEGPRRAGEGLAYRYVTLAVARSALSPRLSRYPGSRTAVTSMHSTRTGRHDRVRKGTRLNRGQGGARRTASGWQWGKREAQGTHAHARGKGTAGRTTSTHARGSLRANARRPRRGEHPASGVEWTGTPAR